jgi:hypothetical protein
MKSSIWRIFSIFAVCLMPSISMGAQSAISTFHSIGLYWSPAGGSSSVTADVQYRAQGASTWQSGLPLWFDTRNSEYRGSIVNLIPGTTYDIALSINGVATTSLTAATWSENFPIASTVYLPQGVTSQTYNVSQSGTASGYVLYTFPPGGSTTIDVAGNSDNNITVNASYVIIRGLTLKGAAADAIMIADGMHDVVIEGNDISGWGRIASDGFGENYDAAVKGAGSISRLVVQRNKMHHPRSNANDWTQNRPLTGKGYHPEGPQSVVYFESPGNNVLRYNEVYSDSNHRFNDGMGAGFNFSTAGYPGADSDVYGNYVADVCDDALEMEGGGRNVRVFGNYMERTYVGIADTTVSVGPIYMFRNVVGQTRRDNSMTSTGVFAKLGDEGSYGVGRQYWIHNTVLEPNPHRRTQEGLSTYGGPYTNAISYNNIFDVRAYSIETRNMSTLNYFDYDLYDARIIAGTEPHGIKAAPIYAAGNGPVSGRGGMYQLASNSPGYDAGVRLPGFNDNYRGAGPDMGAHESGAPGMQFGVNANWIISGSDIDSNTTTCRSTNCASNR